MKWKKKAQRHRRIAKQHCTALFEQIDRLNAREDEIFGSKDLPETGTGSAIVFEAIKAKRLGSNH